MEQFQFNENFASKVKKIEKNYKSNLRKIEKQLKKGQPYQSFEVKRND